MNTELIQLKEVVKKFKKNVVLDGVSLSIPEGKITGIIGASGEGKSTILKLLIGFYRPTSGKVLYLKRNVQEDVVHINKTFGFATEDGSFYGELTVKENLEHFGNLYKMKSKDIKDRAMELMRFVGLERAQNTRAQNLSVGMKKRLDFACSMMHKPDVMIMDEPTADLDPILRKSILALITSIRDSGTTIVITTQLLEEMDTICDKIAILHQRKIVEEGEPEKIRKKYKARDLNEVFGHIFAKTKRRVKRVKLKGKEVEVEEEEEEDAGSSYGATDAEMKRDQYRNPDQERYDAFQDRSDGDDKQ